MSDPPDRSKPSIPAWQTDYIQTSSRAAQPQPPGAADEFVPQDHDQLLEHARKFLQDDEIRDASRERKVAFLQKKGLQNDNIEEILGQASDQDTVLDGKPGSEIKTIHDSTATQNDVRANSSKSEPSKVSNTKRDIPPIITYPEFVLKPQKPPPLVTFQRLAYAAYAFAGFATLTYGASKYLVQPMLESLHEARHELAESALEDLDKLNQKLESNVSHIPVMTSSQIMKKAAAEHDDADSITSDPTELFHRDFGTQTSPQPSRSSSIDSAYNLADSKTKDATAHQASRLSSLKTLMTSLTSSTSTAFSQDALKESISDLQILLDDLQLTQAAHLKDYSGTFSTIPGQFKNDNATSKTKSDSGESAKFKAEIRALKGAFLSSRNFPVARAQRADFSSITAGAVK